MPRSRTRRSSPAAGGARRTSRREPAVTRRWLAVGLLCVTFAAYYPAWHGTPVWDDDEHLTRAELQTPEGLWRIWTDLGSTQQYYPVTHSAFWLQHRVWGDATTGYHLTSLALHCLSALLLFTILARLAVPGAGLAAVLFALHPMQVESVAWITELKNTLSGALYLLAALTYLRFDERRTRELWTASFLLFLAALFAKTVTATLPAALLVIFWWQRSRLDLRRDVMPLMPFFAVGLGAGLLTGWVEHAIIGAAGTEFALSPADRILLAGRAIWFYAATLAWPSSLVFTYPRWTIDATAWWQYVYPAAAVAATVVFFRIRNRSRAPLAAWLLFVGTLVPALGFVNVYPFRFSFVADHFAYIATMPFAAVTAAVAVTLLRRLELPDARTAAIGTLALGLPLWLLTFESSQRFQNAETLYRRTLADNPDSWLANGQLGILLHQQGRLDEALSHYDRARSLNPSLASAHNNACSVLWQLGRLRDARTACASARALDPNDPEVYFNSGKVSLLSGDTGDARKEFEQALRLVPDHPGAHYELARLDASAGRLDDAVRHYEDVLRAAPVAGIVRAELAAVLVTRGTSFAAAGRTDQARVDFTRALELDPASEAARQAAARLDEGTRGSGS